MSAVRGPTLSYLRHLFICGIPLQHLKVLFDYCLYAYRSRVLGTKDGIGLKPISCSDCEGINGGSTELQGGAAIRLYVTKAFALGIVVS